MNIITDIGQYNELGSEMSGTAIHTKNGINYARARRFLHYFLFENDFNTVASLLSHLKWNNIVLYEIEGFDRIEVTNNQLKAMLSEIPHNPE